RGIQLESAPSSGRSTQLPMRNPGESMHRNRLLPVLAALAFAPAAFAQGVTGSAMTGSVTDKGGGPLGGVAIQLRNPSSGDTYNASSGKDGRYFLDNVRAG